MPLISFKTFGCKVNQYETQVLREIFLKKGYKESNKAKRADSYLINTCTVTQKSDQEAAHFIRSLIRNNPKSKIIVAGCCLKNKNSVVLKIPAVIKKIKSRFSHPISDFKGRNRAFIKIQDGCHNFCSYCIVPLVRGKPKSRQLKEIVKEVTALVKKGFKEIVLSGIHLGAYGIDFTQHLDIIDVIEKLEKIKGDFRLRLSSLDPDEVSDKLIKKFKTSPKLCRQIHIPLQSGDNKILKLMNRRYSRAKYLSLVKKLRKNIPNISITTDIIVGFPGETETNFQNTLNLVKKISFCRAHIFSYSKREGTRAYNFPNQLPLKVIRGRFKKLKAAAEKSSLRYRRKFLNKTVEVLIEDRRDKKTNMLCGYSEYYFKVLLKGPDKLKNQLVRVKVKKIENNYVYGILLPRLIWK